MQNGNFYAKKGCKQQMIKLYIFEKAGLLEAVSGFEWGGGGLDYLGTTNLIFRNEKACRQFFWLKKTQKESKSIFLKIP